ncbi:MAG: FG-GAP-like repeat-containing protein [Candidatus Zixiibacteriota bacterium]|jgi:hypothetical protein
MSKSLPVFLALVVISNPAGIAQVPLESNPFWQSSPANVYSTGMIWRDCNNDGFIDLFVSNGNDIVRTKNHIYLSYGDSLPTSPSWQSANGEYSGHCAVGDIDGDGLPDFLVANYLGANGFSSANLSNLYLNSNGLPHAYPDWYTADSIYSFSCALGDVDGDGDLDAAFATGDGYMPIYQPDAVYLNVDGALSGEPWWQSTAATAAVDVTWGDVDNDGDLDLAFCFDNFPTSVYYNHSGELSTSPDWQSNNTISGNTLVFGDVNNDGWLDLVVAYNSQHSSGNGYFRVYYNDGAGTLDSDPGWQAYAGQGSALALYDYDNDGDDDLAAGAWFSRARVFENLGGYFDTIPAWLTALSTVQEELAWVDVHGDGVEQLADTLIGDGNRRLFYTKHHPLYSIDSVRIDGALVADNRFCFDLVSGWISLTDAPTNSIITYYSYSFKNDLAMSNWDDANMVIANTNSPFLDFSADTTVGDAPLEVQFSDNSTDSDNQLWRFGDGGSGTGQNPTHLYDTAGTFDVYLQADLPEGSHNRTRRRMIIALGDTVYIPDLEYVSSDSIVIPVYLRNSQPVYSMVLPLTFSGDVDIMWSSQTTESCRSDQVLRPALIAYSPSENRLAISLNTYTSTPHVPLPPGDGPILNITFHYVSGNGGNAVDTATLSPNVLGIDSRYLQYQPHVRPGFIRVDICGDINGDGAGPNLADITYLIGYVYIGGPEPLNLKAANTAYHDDTRINLADITALIGYVYLDGPDLICHGVN